MYKTIFPILGLALLSGCSMAPDYERPASPVPEAYGFGGSDSATSPASIVPAWRDYYAHAELQELIELALANNRSLRVSQLSTEQIRAYYRIQRAALLPSLDAAGTGTRQHNPADLSATGRDSTTSAYAVGLQMPAYELDFFGRILSLKDQALKEYLATEQAQRSAELSLITSVANQYYLLIALEEQKALAAEAKQTAQRAFDINQDSFDAGVGSELDLRTSEAQLQAYRAAELSFQEQVAQARNLLGQLVGTGLPEFAVSGDLLRGENAPAELPVGLPSDLLTRRPDVLAAEYILQGANANIGAARAAFFPSIQLTAFAGTASAELSGLFESGSEQWSFAPSITIPIFAAGRNKANLEVAELQKEIEIANYENAIQTAFREVSDALVVRASVDQRIDAQGIRVQAAERRNELTKQRYDAGVDSYLAVLLAEQELFSAQQNLVQARLSKLTNQTALFAALGGGFDGSQMAEVGDQ